MHPRKEKEDDNRPSASGSKHDRKLWLQSTEEYNDVVEDGPELLSSMVSAAKISWEKP